MSVTFEYLLSITIVISAVIGAGLLMAACMGKLIFSLLPFVKNRRKNLEQNGVEAEAVILKMERDRGRDASMVRMQMQVRPDKGRNFIAEIYEPLSRSEQHRFRDGMVVKVKFNPENYKELMLVC